MPEDFISIGIVNRFDQASAAQCGQYRLIFARRNLTAESAYTSSSKRRCRTPGRSSGWGIPVM